MKNRPIDITFILHINIFPQDIRQRFIFDTGIKGSQKDRISVYIKNNLLIFSVMDRTGEAHFIYVETKNLINSFHSMLFEVENKSDKSVISIFNDNTLIVSKDIDFPLIFTNNPFEENYFIGSDIMGNNHCSFEIAEQLVYGNVLSAIEKDKIFNYLKLKHSPEPKSKIKFINGAYLYRDNVSNNMIQPVLANQPKFLNSQTDTDE